MLWGQERKKKKKIDGKCGTERGWRPGHVEQRRRQRSRFDFCDSRERGDEGFELWSGARETEREEGKKKKKHTVTILLRVRMLCLRMFLTTTRTRTQTRCQTGNTVAQEV